MPYYSLLIVVNDCLFPDRQMYGIIMRKSRNKWGIFL